MFTQESLAELIHLYEELMEQSHLEVLFFFLKQNTTEMGRFFSIFQDFKITKRLNEALALDEINHKLNTFFAQNGIQAMHDTFCNFDAFISKVNLKDDLQLQLTLYLLAYVYHALNVNAAGKIIEKLETDYTSHLAKILIVLQRVGFTPADVLYARLNIFNRETEQSIVLQAAKKGNLAAQGMMCQYYFSHLVGTLNHQVPPAYHFPEGITEQTILEWAINVREWSLNLRWAGHTSSLANMKAFMVNFFKVSAALYQETVSFAQKQRILQMANIIKFIAGNASIVAAVDKILQFKGSVDEILRQHHAIRDEIFEKYFEPRYVPTFDAQKMNLNVTQTIEQAQREGNAVKRHKALLHQITRVEKNKSTRP